MVSLSFSKKVKCLLTFVRTVFLPYLTAKCLVPQVSEQFAGNKVESHKGEHAGAGIHLLRALKVFIICLYKPESRGKLFFMS